MKRVQVDLILLYLMAWALVQPICLKQGLTLFLIVWRLQTDVWSAGGWGFCAHISSCDVEPFPKSSTLGHLLVHLFPAFSTLAASYIPLYLCLCVGHWISSSASERSTFFFYYSEWAWSHTEEDPSTRIVFVCTLCACTPLNTPRFR